MVATIAPEPISLASSTLGDFRSRFVTGERSLLQDLEPTPQRPSGDTGFVPSEPAEAPREETPNALPPGAMFAAAVAAGALAPVPETREELILRVGQNWNPPASELNLADRLA